PAGQERDHRTQRNQCRGPAAGHPFGRVAGSRRLLAALIGQPGLPDSCPAIDHDARDLARAKSSLEHLELRPTADNRPPPQWDPQPSQHVSPDPDSQLPTAVIRRVVTGQAVTTADLSPATTPMVRSARWRGTPSSSRVAPRWAAARSKWASPMPRPRWAPAM